MVGPQSKLCLIDIKDLLSFYFITVSLIKSCINFKQLHPGTPMQTNVRKSTHEFFGFSLFHKMLIVKTAATTHLLVPVSSEIALLVSTIACLVDTTTSF